MEIETKLKCGCISGKCKNGVFNIWCSKDNPYQGLPKELEGKSIISVNIRGVGEYIEEWGSLGMFERN